MQYIYFLSIFTSSSIDVLNKYQLGPVLRIFYVCQLGVSSYYVKKL